ncbi:hypothetical protein BX285_4929 [Streptomyces sp. 1114.5]|uniref:hypothetical protein n=1 Tax=unclassified Streptomyces TaxID=2593676 RepID=UPI000BD9EAA9|nr:MULTISPECIES: hypothetical protein [unclassified Streptomyces]RKT10995.1 hypothetical protein BX285_4929 [Streptomyces sp. 1114.5]SOB81669.1 hypothetical protein SAMN06272789_1806 [Streptomyces sp. 1331.2]
MTAEHSQNPRPVTPRLSADPTFDQELCGLVLDTAPRMFAVVQVCGEGFADADGWVVAWGLVDDPGPTHVISVDGRARMTLASPDRVLRHFAGRPGITSRLVWLAQPRAAAMNQSEAA